MPKNLGRALPPLIWTKSKRTATFFRETFPNIAYNISAHEQLWNNHQTWLKYKISLFPAHCDIRSTLWSIFLTMYQYFQDTVINISNRNINISSTWTTLRSLWRLSVILGSRWWSWVSLQGGTSTRLRLNSQFWKCGPTYTYIYVGKIFRKLVFQAKALRQRAQIECARCVLDR